MNRKRIANASQTWRPSRGLSLRFEGFGGCQVCGSVEVGCPHQGHGCPHLCMRGDLKHHLSMCPYESLKDLLEEKERTIQDLQKAVRMYLQPLLYRESSWAPLEERVVGVQMTGIANSNRTYRLSVIGCRTTNLSPPSGPL